jgi:transposase
MADAHVSSAGLNTLDRETLQALVLSQQEKLLSQGSEIEHLKLVIAKLRRMMFGTESEKVTREIEQLELKLEELETRQAERAETTPTTTPPKNKPTRSPLPEHLAREVHTHLPQEDACRECGGELRKLGEDVAEMLEYIPASFKVIRHVRPKLCCTRCDAILQAAAPSRPIDRGLAGPGLLAHVLVVKYADHLPLYRQSEIYAREGVDVDRSTLADWSEHRATYSLLWSIRCASMCSRQPSCTPMTRRCLCWPQVWARPRRRGCGPMCVMIVLRATTHHRQCGSLTRKIARAIIPSSI